jgi:nucleoside-diphosphate kinase
MSYTFAIIKPTAVKRKQIGEIITYIEDSGLVISRLKTLTLTHDQTRDLYAEHAGKDFFNDLCAYMMSGPVVIMELYLPHGMCLQCGAWEYWRCVIGATDPADADERTIRRTFGINRRENAVHGSDSENSAKRELSLFFDLTQRVIDVKDIEFGTMINTMILKTNAAAAAEEREYCCNHCN